MSERTLLIAFEIEAFVVIIIAKRGIHCPTWASVQVGQWIPSYRPGQPNWEYTIFKSQDFPAAQILREINFGHFEALKTAILTI